jgi:recombination protein RecT
VRLTGRANPLLLACDPWSYVGAAVELVRVGLEPGIGGLSALIPRGKEVVPLIMYRGYVELAYRSGLVRDVSAELVYDGDHFRVVKGTSPKIEHADEGPPGEREIVAAYAVAHLKTGGTVAKVIYADDWEKAREASQLGAKGKGPWIDHRPAMIRKTALRRLEPWLPKTSPLVDMFRMDETPVRLDDLLQEAATDAE